MWWWWGGRRLVVNPSVRTRYPRGAPPVRVPTLRVDKSKSPQSDESQLASLPNSARSMVRRRGLTVAEAGGPIEELGLLLLFSSFSYLHLCSCNPPKYCPWVRDSFRKSALEGRACFIRRPSSFLLMNVLSHVES